MFVLLKIERRCKNQLEIANWKEVPVTRCALSINITGLKLQFQRRYGMFSVLGRLLVALQFGLLLLLFWPWDDPRFSMAASVLFLAAIVFGILTLRHNRPGNFNIRPEPSEHTQLIAAG